MLSFVLLAIGLLHIDKPYLEARVDVLELNHVYDAKATPILHQLIGWKWDDGELHIDWWCLAECEQTRLRLCGTYAELHWCSTWYRVNYGEYKETWKQYDVELGDRERWPLEWRRGLPERIPKEEITLP